MGVKTKQKKIKPARDIPYASASLCEATEAISAQEIVYISGRSGSVRQVTLADASAAISSVGTLLIAKHDVPSGGLGIFLPWQLVTGLNTAANTLGDTVYLSGATPGGTVDVPTAGSEVRRTVGIVREVSATTGVIDVDLSDHGEIIAGTGLPASVIVNSMTITPLGATTLTIIEAQTIIDAWLAVTTGGSTENLSLTNNAANVITALATGTVVTGDVVRADNLLNRSITAGNDLVADLSASALAGVLYILTVRA